VPNFSSPEAAYYLLALTVPAVVFMYARVQFTHGRMPKASEAVLHYIAITTIYYGFAYPIILVAVRTPGNELTWWAGWLALLFFVPAGLGLLVGWIAQKGFIYDFARRIGFLPVHIIPTAWEWRFAKCEGEWVVVTLKNGNAYGAECAAQSFISTEPGERDLYLECTYDIDEQGNWTPRGFGMLIAGGEVSTIEFDLRDSRKANEQNPDQTAAS
jgi:hypothetical protein